MARVHLARLGGTTGEFAGWLGVNKETLPMARLTKDSVNDSTPAPLETGEGAQKDDNIDDLGHRPDGKTQDQPVGHHAPADKPKKSVGP